MASRRTAACLVGLVSAFAVLALAATSSASVLLRGVDVGAYPTVRATVVTSQVSNVPPTLTENGNGVVGLTARNLGHAKSVVLAIDRSRSMAGRSFLDAVMAARAFVADKSASDQVAIVAFGSRALKLTGFSSATIDAQAALRTVDVDSRSGTALYDALRLSAQMLATQGARGRVVVLLTDGHDVSSSSSFADAVAAAHVAGAVVYPIGIATDANSTDVLRRMAHETGGTFHRAASSSALRAIYAGIAAELRHTWRLEYVTAARPGDKLKLEAQVAGQGSATVDATVRSDGPPSLQSAPVLPGPAFGPIGTFLFVLGIALLVLTAGVFALATEKGAWLRGRLAPHVEPTRRGPKRLAERERFAMFSGLFSVTENAFSQRKAWRKIHLMLDRADVPLRTVEFAWICIGGALVLGLLAAITGRSSLVILFSFVLGGGIPYGVVWFKARRRMRAFENQLPDILITMAASLKAGHSFKQGMQAIVDEGEEPASKELKRVLTDTRLGRPMDEALAETADRLGSKNFSFVITAVTIQRQVGGSLAGLFDMVADTVRQRHQFARKIRGLTAMGRASAYVLVGLPFFVAAAITLLNPDYMHPLWHSSTGHTLIFVGLAMMAFGSLVLKKIVSFKG
jgi:tight adherence protein B